MAEVYDFGVVLQKLRKERGMTQEQLARKINKESSIISRYEKNLQSPTFETVRSFAEIFNVSMDYLSGMEKSVSISTVNLSSKQADLLRCLADEFRRSNTGINKTMSDEHYALVGKIVCEIARQK